MWKRHTNDKDHAVLLYEVLRQLKVYRQLGMKKDGSAGIFGSFKGCNHAMELV